MKQHVRRFNVWDKGEFYQGIAATNDGAVPKPYHYFEEIPRPEFPAHLRPSKPEYPEGCYLVSYKNIDGVDVKDVLFLRDRCWYDENQKYVDPVFGRKILASIEGIKFRSEEEDERT